MFQNIISFITQNAFLIIIIGGGLFNVAVRLAQKTKEQRVRREALHEMDHQKQEALRTGRTMSPNPVSVAKDPRDERRDRIEALRQERMEQLRALREKRSKIVSASQSSVSQGHPGLPQIPLPTHRPTQQAQQLQRQAQQPQAQRRTPVPSARQTRRPQIVASSQQVQSTRRRTTKTPPKALPQAHSRKAGQLESLSDAAGIRPVTSAGQQASQSARSMLRSRSSIRQAMILREILDTPIALRDQDIASGSLFN